MDIRKGDTIKIVKKGALRPGARGAVQKVGDDGKVTALFPSGSYKVDAGEYAVVTGGVGDTIEVLKKGALAAGARGVIERLHSDGRVEARFAEGSYKVDAGDYLIV